MLRLFLPLAICLSASACARGLGPGEADFADALFGASLDRESIVVQAGAGLHPPPEDPLPEVAEQAPPAPSQLPEGVCTRLPSPREGFQWPAGVVFWNRVVLKRDFYRADMFEGWPRAVPMPHALLMAHELVHVWQWQNRARTGYDPATSGSESLHSRDPYWYVPEGNREFLTFGYEQQAAMIEDYVCYTMFEPQAARRAELRALIDPVLPLEDFDNRLGR